MLSWMLYALLVSLLLGLAALAFEQAARLGRRPARWLWLASMIASLAIPFMPSGASVQIPDAPRVERMSPADASAPKQVVSIELPRLALPDIGVDRTPLSDDVSSLLVWTWRVTSTALVLAILANAVHLAWRRRRWDSGHMAGVPVCISEDCGPAVVGIFRPVIVVPRWLMGLSTEVQDIVIAHERSHLRAFDTQLLTIAVVLLACMPWNPILWWQLRRLRLAIEVDCDARVLKLGYPVARYSDTLITVGERQSATYAVMMATYGARPFLERRIRNMLHDRIRYARVWALTSACLGVGLAVCAAEVTAPATDVAGRTAFQIASADPQSAQAPEPTDIRALRSQILRMQAEGMADKLTQFIREIQNQVGWVTQLPPWKNSIEERRFDALKLLRFNPPITELSLLDAQGKEYLKVSRLALDVVGSGTDYSSEPKFTETIAKKIYYGPVYMRRESEPYMTMAIAGGRPDAGVSIVELNLKPMWDLVQRTRVGARGIAYVVNAEGRIIAHPDFSIGKSLRDVSPLEQVREARAAVPMDRPRIVRDINDQDVVAAYARVPGTGWLVIVELPAAEWTGN